MSPAPFDIAAIRAKFPALSGDLVYFDNAGGSQTLGTVIDSIRDYLSRSNVQLGATYAVGKKATDRYYAGYQAGAKYINASQEQIVFGSSTTQLFRNVSYALRFAAGDELVLSGIDHEANIAAWVDLADRQGLTIKWWKPHDPKRPILTAEGLSSLLSDRTRLVTCTHASNILGTIHDIPAIAAMVHERSPALLCVDGVAYAPHRPIDVQALGVDLYAFSWYKVFGPHISMLYASSRALEQLKPLSHFFNPTTTLENKLGLAGASYELTQAIPAVLDYLGPADSGVWAAVKEQEHKLQSALLDYLNRRPDITIAGETSADPNVRVATISFTVEGWNSRELVETVERRTNVGFRWGCFYSNRLVQEVMGLGSEGVVRVSMVHYNTVAEVQAFIAALDEVLSRPR